MMNTFVTVLLEQAVQRYVKLSPEIQEKLLPLQGKVLKMELIGWKVPFYFLLHPESIRVQNYYEGPVDATIKGSPVTLLHISLGNTETSEKLADTIDITGDAALAQTLSQIIQHSQIEWEEPLSRLVGDSVSHQVGNIVKSTRDWSKEALKNLQQHISEYLQHEKKHLPPKEEVEEFFTEVAELHKDVEHLATRLRKLT